MYTHIHKTHRVLQSVSKWCHTRTELVSQMMVLCTFSLASLVAAVIEMHVCVCVWYEMREDDGELLEDDKILVCM